LRDQGERHCYRIAVLLDPQSRGGSTAMHGHVEGDTITISEPRNHFPLEQAPHTLLMAGGIGITPLLCMARALDAAGDSFSLHYCTRSRARTAFFEEVMDFGGRSRLHMSGGQSSQRLDVPAVLAAQPPDTRLYVCGPPGFIGSVIDAATSRGWPAQRIHREYFGGAPQDHSGDREFHVRLASTGVSFLVPADKSVATALHEQGISIPVSCEEGVCGTCITRVLQGECDHRDLYLTDDEKARNDQFTPCCSRARSSLLVLDL
jgi:vanillate O-demethylase ferredoxin subunit